MTIKYSKLEKFLRHRDFILCVAIFSVIWLAPNTYYVYYSMMGSYDPIWREIVSGGVALLVVSGILIYTLDGDIKVANYYMWFEISMSSYYYITTIGWNWGLIPAFSFVFMLPISLKHYTIKLNKDTGLIEDDTLQIQFAKQIDVLIDSHLAKEKVMSEAIVEGRKRENELIAVINEYKDKQSDNNEYMAIINKLNIESGAYKERIAELIAESEQKIAIDKPDTITNLSESELLKMVENLKNPPASLPSDDMF